MLLTHTIFIVLHNASKSRRQLVLGGVSKERVEENEVDCVQTFSATLSG